MKKEDSQFSARDFFMSDSVYELVIGTDILDNMERFMRESGATSLGFTSMERTGFDKETMKHRVSVRLYSKKTAPSEYSVNASHETLFDIPDDVVSTELPHVWMGRCVQYASEKFSESLPVELEKHGITDLAISPMDEDWSRKAALKAMNSGISFGIDRGN